MKKKPLLFALLALAIVTSLTAGTLAVYTKSVSLAGDVEVKKFAFDAKGGSATGVNAIKLAPTETQTYRFNVTNFEGAGAAAEVPLEYTIKVDIDGADTMVGLTAVLTKGTEELGRTTNGVFTTAVQNLPANTKTTDDYVVTLTWNDVQGDETQSSVGKTAATFSSGLKVSVNAVQAITANNNGGTNNGGTNNGGTNNGGTNNGNGNNGGNNGGTNNGNGNP